MLYFIKHEFSTRKQCYSLKYMHLLFNIKVRTYELMLITIQRYSAHLIR